METATAKTLNLGEEELNLLTEVLESEKVKLAVEIRHTDKRTFRDGLRRRLDLVETVLARLQG